MTMIVNIPADYRPTIGELPGDLSRIAAVIDGQMPGHGVEVALVLAQAFSGQPLYIRDVKYLLRRMRDDAIRMDYDAGRVTMIELATKYGLSHIRIKQILATPNTPPAREARDRRQLQMF